jgi:hypothetical protein
MQSGSNDPFLNAVNAFNSEKSDYTGGVIDSNNYSHYSKHIPDTRTPYFDNFTYTTNSSSRLEEDYSRRYGQGYRQRRYLGGLPLLPSRKLVSRPRTSVRLHDMLTTIQLQPRAAALLEEDCINRGCNHSWTATVGSSSYRDRGELVIQSVTGRRSDTFHFLYIICIGSMNVTGQAQQNSNPFQIFALRS